MANNTAFITLETEAPSASLALDPASAHIIGVGIRVISGGNVVEEIMINEEDEFLLLQRVWCTINDMHDTNYEFVTRNAPWVMAMLYMRTAFGKHKSSHLQDFKTVSQYDIRVKDVFRWISEKGHSLDYYYALMKGKKSLTTETKDLYARIQKKLDMLQKFYEAMT